jgi:hypothetical protein
MPSVSGHKSSKKPGKRRVTHIRVHKAANGFTVHHEMEPMKTRKPGGGLMSNYEPDPPPAVFNDKDAMMAHVGGLADQMGGDEPGAPPPDGGPAQA